MRAIDAVTAHYSANRTQSMAVPEWSTQGEPLRIYWQLLTIEKRKKLSANPNASDVDVLIAMAEDGEGKPLFTLEDKPPLILNADVTIISRIVAKMLGTDRVTEDMVEAAAKN